jgi:hypothetical protein
MKIISVFDRRLQREICVFSKGASISARHDREDFLPAFNG